MILQFGACFTEHPVYPLSPQKSRFNAKVVHARLLNDEVEMGQVFTKYFNLIISV
jgi:hypothetical protein